MWDYFPDGENIFGFSAKGGHHPDPNLQPYSIPNQRPAKKLYCGLFVLGNTPFTSLCGHNLIAPKRAGLRELSAMTLLYLILAHMRKWPKPGSRRSQPPFACAAVPPLLVSCDRAWITFFSTQKHINTRKKSAKIASDHCGSLDTDNQPVKETHGLKK